MDSVKVQEPANPSFLLPWDRFWARCIDLAIHALLFFLIYMFSGIGSYVYKLNQAGWSYIKLYIIVWPIVCVVFLLYESIFLSIYGATPGKALFRIRVTGSDGKKLSFGVALLRAISLYWFSCYFFLFSFDVFVIGYWFSGRYYKKTGIFKWDKIINSSVSQKPLKPFCRKIFIIFAVFCIALRLLPSLIVVNDQLTKLLKKL